MKVNINEQIDISDDQRVALARLLDDAGSRKRQATRQEIKDYVWLHGVEWATALAEGITSPVLRDAEVGTEDLLGDLLGTGPDDAPTDASDDESVFPEDLL